MVVTKTRNIENNIYTTVLSFECSDDEKNLLENFPIVINYSSLVTSGIKVKVVNGHATQSDDGIETSIILPTRTVDVTPDTTISYEVDSSELDIEDTDYTTVDEMAQCKIFVFEYVIENELIRQKGIAEYRMSGFEGEEKDVI